jgi:anti-sigma regulatory factor (Ser/Thr protein kinase)
VALTREGTLQAPHDHVVQFYASGDELADGVAPYLAEALEAGATAIVIATEDHHRLFADRLAAAGVDGGPAGAGGRLVRRDAAETMAALLVDGRLDPRRFDEVIGSLLREATAAGRPVAAYGEIVALLWAEGHVTAALELEALWNGLGREVDFSLYCAYPLATVEGEGDADAFHEACRLHSAVLGSPVALPRLGRGPLERARAFPCDVRAPAAARQFVSATLVSWGRPELVDDALVIASELATNAVLHAGGDFTVKVVRHADGTVRVAVRDGSTVAPRARRAAPGAGSGRGLALVSALAGRWGAHLTPEGKVVWAQLGR